MPRRPGLFQMSGGPLDLGVAATNSSPAQSEEARHRRHHDDYTVRKACRRSITLGAFDHLPQAPGSVDPGRGWARLLSIESGFQMENRELMKGGRREGCSSHGG